MPSAFEVTPPAKATILIVEDEGIIARDIANRVRKAGYEVAGIVTSGEEALEKAWQARPDLVLMDIRLQGKLDGIETAEQLRERQDIAVIYLTAHTDRETLQRAKITGPFGYLSKPIPQASLPTSIEVALHKHRSEREIREQRAWLQTTLGKIADGVVVADNHGIVRYLNPAGERLTGWIADEARNQPVERVLRLIHGEQEWGLKDLLPLSAQDEETFAFPAGLQLVTALNERFSLEGEICLSKSGGSTFGGVITFRDVTRRQEEEAERRHEQKMKAVGRLAAGIAHDFNNLLTVMLGHSVLLLNTESQLPEPARHAVEEIKRAGDTAARLTRQLLAFSRHKVTTPTFVNLNALVRDNEDLCRALIGSQITWRTALDPQLKTIYADPSQLVQVLANLVANARDAMPSGGTVTVSTKSVEIPAANRLASDTTEEYVMLTVDDTGTGIDSATAEHIFEPFFTTKPAGSGTGLGLSIVHAIISDLGGTVSVKSTPGVGSTFVLILPVSPQSSSDSRTSDQTVPPETATGPGTILLVDDDDAVRTLMTKCLDASRFKVLEAVDGRQALTLAESYNGHIDVLVTDVVMPKMSGFQLAEHLTRARPHVKTLFVSGYAHDVLTGRHTFVEDHRFLQKPFAPSDLLSAVQALIQREVTVSAE